MNEYEIGLELLQKDFRSLELSEDPWLRYEFKIVFSDENEIRHDVGTMRVYKLNYAEMARRRESLFTAFDDLSMEAAQCYDVLFDDAGNLREEFWDAYRGLEEWFARDFHFLDRIEVAEKFKGQRIAGLATAIYLENFANGDDVAYLKAFPLQHESQFNETPYHRAFKGAYKQNLSRLCRYYESLGFRRIGKTEHFFFVVDDFLSRWQEGNL